MMNNMNQNNGGMQKRMLIMTLVVFVFFIAYEFLVLKPQQEAKQAKITQEQVQKANSAPSVEQQNTMANGVTASAENNSKSVDALSSKAVASKILLQQLKQNIIYLKLII